MTPDGKVIVAVASQKLAPYGQRSLDHPPPALT